MAKSIQSERRTPRVLVAFDPRRLSRLTALAGLTKGDVAAAAKLSVSTIAAAYAGRLVGVRSAAKIAAAVGSTIAELAAPDVGEPVASGTRR